MIFPIEQAIKKNNGLHNIAQFFGAVSLESIMSTLLLQYLGIKRSPSYRNAVVLHKNLQR